MPLRIKKGLARRQRGGVTLRRAQRQRGEREGYASSGYGAYSDDGWSRTSSAIT
jgi:hypothetical protein